MRYCYYCCSSETELRPCSACENLNVPLITFTFLVPLYCFYRPMNNLIAIFFAILLIFYTLCHLLINIEQLFPVSTVNSQQ